MNRAYASSADLAEWKSIMCVSTEQVPRKTSQVAERGANETVLCALVRNKSGFIFIRSSSGRIKVKEKRLKDGWNGVDSR